MFSLLFVSSVSAAFEWDNDLPYERSPYTVRLDGTEVLRAETNVFSLFDLTPATAYTVEADGCSLSFTTRAETALLSAADFGAAGDGRRDDTRALQDAIDAIPAGGRLRIPAGTYRVSPLTLKSHITLDLAAGAVLLGETDKTVYPVIPAAVQDPVSGAETVSGVWEGSASPMYQALLYGTDLSDVAIVGRGTVDGNAQNARWWQDFKSDPVARPRLFFVNRSKGITLHGITAQNAASWQMHPFLSRDIRFYDIAVNAPDDSPNTDAIDPECCDGVAIVGCRFSVGDDCIALKSGKLDLAEKLRRPADHHTVRNCLMYRGHGAVVLGSETAGGVRNLSVSRCVFVGTDRGLRIKTRRGRGKASVVDGVLFENIRMDGVKTPLVINMWYNCNDPDRYSDYVRQRGGISEDERTPFCGAFVFRRMTCENCHVAAAYFDGLTEKPIGSVTLEDIRFSYANDASPGKPAMQNDAPVLCRAGIVARNVGSLTVCRVTVEGVAGDALVTENVTSETRDALSVR